MIVLVMSEQRRDEFMSSSTSNTSIKWNGDESAVDRSHTTGTSGASSHNVFQSPTSTIRSFSFTSQPWYNIHISQ